MNNNFYNLVLLGILARVVYSCINLRCWSQNECLQREFRKILLLVLVVSSVFVGVKLIRSNPFHMDTEGTMDSVHINVVSY